MLQAASLLVLLLAVYLGWPLPFRIQPLEPLEAPGAFKIASAGGTVHAMGVDIEVVSTVRGRLFGSTVDGRLYEIKKQEGSWDVKLFARHPPWVGQIKADTKSDRVYYVCAPGLCSMLLTESSLTDQRILASEADGLPIGLPNGLDVAPSGLVYLTDSLQRRFTMEAIVYDITMTAMFAGERTGRLLEYNPATKETRVLVDGLHFANGVTVSPDGSFLVISETMSAKLWRVWLDGPRKGEREQFGPALPAFPDNLHADETHLYVALPIPRNPVTEFLLHAEWGRWLAAKLPKVEAKDPAQFVRYEWQATGTLPGAFKLYTLKNVPASTGVLPWGADLLLCSYMQGGPFASVPVSELEASG